MWNKKFILKILLSGFLVLVFSVNYFCDEVMAAALPTPSSNLLQTFGKGLRFGDPSVFLNNEENLIWGVLNGGSGTGSIIKIQNDSFSDIFRIGWNGNLITSGFVQGTQLCIGAECRSSWPDVGSASGWVKSGSNVALSTITDRVGIGISSPQSKLHVSDRVELSRMGTVGTYNSSQVQQIWSIGRDYNISTSNNDFGSSFGIVYAHTNAGTATNKKPIANWGHQILFTSSGIRNAAISLTNGHAYFAGNVGIGTTNPGSYKLYVAGSQYINNDLKVSGGIAAGGYDPSATHRITTPTFYAERAQIGGASGELMTAGSLNAKQLCIEGNCKSSWGPNSSLRTKVNIAATPDGVDYVCPAGYVMVGIENSYPAKLICDRMW
jgi:hypothetical protein